MQHRNCEQLRLETQKLFRQIYIYYTRWIVLVSNVYRKLIHDTCNLLSNKKNLKRFMWDLVSKCQANVALRCHVKPKNKTPAKAKQREAELIFFLSFVFFSCDENWKCCILGSSRSPNREKITNQISTLNKKSKSGFPC